ncbi:carbohydrate kinase family protein [Synechococcus sp. A10-1-5-9]|uniref:carbohydrate kinase family protein n=1 Tax=Synechococcus sp. A10-1-5-9 TaxID=3392295 RepID=UPI0039ED30E3
MDCLCLGLLCADLVCHPVPALPNQGQLMETERMELSLGGCAANTAFDLSKLGVNTGISGCVGNDVLADFIVQTLNAAGVDTRGVVRSNEEATASTAVINVTDQDRRFISYAGANKAMTAALIPDGLLEAVSVLYIGGFLMLDGLESEAMLQRLAQAREAGTRILLDVVQVGDANAMERLQRFLPFTDVFLPNNDEAALLTGFSNPWEQAEAFRSAGARTVVITEGDRGAHLLNDQLKLRASAYATDFQGGTGAGDAFDAGFIAALLQGHDLPTCLRWGSALGASCVRSTSATGSVFNREEALQFMGSHAITVESC